MQVGNDIFSTKGEKRMKIALQLYSIRDAVNGENVNEIFASLAEMGYEGIELAGLYGMSAEELKAAADKAGLSVVSAHISYNDLMSQSGGDEGALFRQSVYHGLHSRAYG